MLSLLNRNRPCSAAKASALAEFDRLKDAIEDAADQVTENVRLNGAALDGLAGKNGA